jgi:hypothetical protein
MMRCTTVHGIAALTLFGRPRGKGVLTRLGLKVQSCLKTIFQQGRGLRARRPDGRGEARDFPFTRYGTVPATVTQMSADAVQDDKRGAIFPVTLALERRNIDVDGRRIALAPGMNLSAEIKTGQRRLIDYLLSPVQRAGHESLKER